MEEFISQQYSQLQDLVYCDYSRQCPISQNQIDKIQMLGQKIQPSPHSSEDLSEFDRVLDLLREDLTHIFNTSRVRYATVLFPDMKSAIDSIFEGFPWSEGSHFLLDTENSINQNDFSWSINFAISSGATQVDFSNLKSVRSHSHSLLYCTYRPDLLPEITSFVNNGSGNHQVILDATALAPYEYPNLFEHSLDFCVISLERVCGSHLCACLMRLDTADLLAPHFYGGGAVAFSCARTFTHRNFRSHTKRFENGTPSIMHIFTAYYGLQTVNKILSFEEAKENITNVFNGFMEMLRVKFPTLPVHPDPEAHLVHIEFQNASDVHQKLLSKRICTGLEDGAIRFSFGICSKMADIDIISQALESL